MQERLAQADGHFQRQQEKAIPSPWVPSEVRQIHTCPPFVTNNEVPEAGLFMKVQ